ncbi:MAG: ABC transporter permease [Pseudomonadota bacterium]
MNWQQHFKVAFANLMTSKLRTLLAMLGILVGTASVVAMVSSGQLATQAALAQFKNLGTNLLSVGIYQSSQKQPTKQTHLTLAQSLVISHRVKQIQTVAPYVSLYQSLYYRGKKLDGTIIGATQSLQTVIRIHLLKGRFISFLDRHAFYCVIGYQLAQQLGQNHPTSLIGQQIQMGNHFLTIVGIAKKWPQNSFINEDINQSIIIPIQTAKILSNYAFINSIVMRIKPQYSHAIKPIKAAITKYLTQVIPGKQYYFRSAEEIIKSMENQRRILTILLGLIGSISLLVGGIGVMNIMLVSVVERKREIGIRRAIGAKQSTIQMMFLIEAIILALLGGLAGVILGILIAWFIALYAGWQFSLFLLPPVIGFTVSVLVGIFFGFYPAYQAARLDPIETLRAE